MCKCPEWHQGSARLWISTRDADDGARNADRPGGRPHTASELGAAGLGPVHFCTWEHFLTSWDKVDKN